MELRIQAGRSNARLGACAALACLVMATPVAAEPVRIDFYLTFTSTFGDLSAIGGVPLGVGDRIRGSLAYDSSAPVQRPEQPYWEYRPAGSLTLHFGRDVVLPLEGMVVVPSTVINGFPQPSFVAAFAGTGEFPGFEFIQTELEFRGGDQSNLLLPDSVADLLGRYPTGFLRGAAWQIGVEAPFDSGTQEFFATVTPVPEPGTILLVGGGVALLLRRGRARSPK